MPLAIFPNFEGCCDRIAIRQADTKHVGTHFFQVENKVHDNEVPHMLKKIYNHDFTEFHHMSNIEMAGTSQEDKIFLQILEEGAKLVNGHCKIPLPFRKVDVQLPNNKLQVEKRLASLKKKTARNNKFKDDYLKLMKELISKGYAKNHQQLLNQVVAGTYHTMVDHPNKLGKICVVFDLSAEHHCVLINKELLPGPDLTYQIVGVLLRFREEPLAVTGDIEAMFHQVKVPEQQRNYLIFLWWKDNDLDKDVTDHEMTAHVFGGVSSPSCSNYALKKTASNNLERYGEDG